MSVTLQTAEPPFLPDTANDAWLSFLPVAESQLFIFITFASSLYLRWVLLSPDSEVVF